MSSFLIRIILNIVFTVTLYSLLMCLHVLDFGISRTSWSDSCSKWDLIQLLLQLASAEKSWKSNRKKKKKKQCSKNKIFSRCLPVSKTFWQSANDTLMKFCLFSKHLACPGSQVSRTSCSVRAFICWKGGRRLRA